MNQRTCPYDPILLRQTIAILLRKTLAILLRKTLATLLRKTIAILLRRKPRATPCGRELACEYRTAGLPVKSSPSEKGRI